MIDRFMNRFIDWMIRFLQTKREGIIQFIKFGIIGFFNTILSYALTNFFYYVVFSNISFFVENDPLRTQFSNFVTFVITVFVSFLLNGNYVFNKNKEISFWKALVKVYASYSVTCIFLNGLLLYLEVTVMGLPYYIATLINLFFTIPINFVLNKFWAYKS